MTGSLPPGRPAGLRALRDHGVTTVDATGQPITWPVTPYYRAGAGAIDLTTGHRLPEEGRRRRAQPARVAAVLRPDRLRHGAPVRRARAGNRARSTTRTSSRTRALLAARAARSCRRRKSMHPPAFMRGRLGWYYTAPLHLRAPGARVRLARTATSPRSRRSTARTWRRCAPITPRSRRCRCPRPRAARPPGTTAWTSSAGATRRPCCRWSAPTASRCRAASPIEPDRAAGARAAGRAAGLDARRADHGAASPRTSTSRDFKWQANFQVRGDLVREDGGWALVPHKFVGGFELPKGRLAGHPRELQQDAALPQEGEGAELRRSGRMICQGCTDEAKWRTCDRDRRGRHARAHGESRPRPFPGRIGRARDHLVGAMRHLPRKSGRHDQPGRDRAHAAQPCDCWKISSRSSRRTARGSPSRAARTTTSGR